MRNALALQTDFDSPEIVSEVYADPPSVDGDGEFEEQDVVYMIDQEYCFIGPVHTHTYLNSDVHCCKCGAAHPSIRNSCGQR